MCTGQTLNGHLSPAHQVLTHVSMKERHWVISKILEQFFYAGPASASLQFILGFHRPQDSAQKFWVPETTGNSCTMLAAAREFFIQNESVKTGVFSVFGFSNELTNWLFYEDFFTTLSDAEIWVTGLKGKCAILRKKTKNKKLCQRSRKKSQTCAESSFNADPKKGLQRVINYTSNPSEFEVCSLCEIKDCLHAVLWRIWKNTRFFFFHHSEREQKNPVDMHVYCPWDFPSFITAENVRTFFTRNSVVSEWKGTATSALQGVRRTSAENLLDVYDNGWQKREELSSYLDINSALIPTT